MTGGASKVIYDRIVESCANKLGPLGFSRRGFILRKMANGNTAIIEFQRSTKSNQRETRFTINLGVICKDILDEGQPTPAQASSANAHLRQRIGVLLPGRPDKWWVIEPKTDVDALEAEVSNLIVEVAVPYLEPYLDSNALAELWASGKSPGLTEKQRLEYLTKLNADR